MFEYKPLSPDAVGAALEKAHRYRMLNEPLEAESICLDVLEVEPANQEALVTLLLALTDQFDRKVNEKARQARDLLARLEDEYSRSYYDGIICERRAKVALGQGDLGSGYVAHGWFREAMERYEKAIELRPAGNDDSVLRWNTCARIIDRNPSVQPEPEESVPEMLE